VTLLVRALLIVSVPVNFSFDGFQRWAGREHLLVQVWLPLTQSIVAAAVAGGAGIEGTRLVLAVVSSLAAAAGVLLAGLLAGPRAAWAYLPIACFGPSIAWGSALYQEGTFLLVLFSGLLLAGRGRAAAGDIVIGLLALVRYEGWPCVLLYVAWRRDPRALLALWGMAAWLALRAGGAEGYAASPVDFDDWRGLAERASVDAWVADAARLLRQSVGSGALVIVGAALVGVVVGWRHPTVRLLAGVGALQLAAVAGWLVGLESATHRMLVLPVAILGVLAAVAIARLWERVPKWARLALTTYGAGAGASGLLDAREIVLSEARRLEVDRDLYQQIVSRPACTWRVWPRRGLGTRERHDGCEVIQGQGELRHGAGFWCATWEPPPDPRTTCVVDARWEEGAGYRVTVWTDGQPTPWPSVDD
jgi:hypothetical protein